MSRTPRINRLSRETSPYLLEHAGNPVDWYPFGAEALERARALHQPILLSIGYLACHWCHVMARESFEDEDIAALMNRLYVNIKVDREERPDLDQIYQLAHQILAGRAGGWPLTVFLEPEALTPFFAGTYFPKVPRFGLAGFPDVLIRVEAYFRASGSQDAAGSRRLREIFESIAHGDPVDRGEGARDAVSSAMAFLTGQFDARFGGFGPAPKFPRASALSFLLDAGLPAARPAPEDPPPLTLLTTTLTRMAEGGLHDPIGGGFFRYSVDAQWHIPHFEKMLYDNALLLPIYAEASARTGMRNYREVAVTTAHWMLKTMRDREGGFYSSLDADSDSGEGGYYLWDAREVEQRLTAEEWSLIAPHYGLDAPANFEGRWHLAVQEPAADLATRLGLEREVVEARLRSGLEKLAAARAKRAPPRIDEKILVSANGLAIAGLARAGRILDQEDWIDGAWSAARFIRSRLVTSGRLMSSFCGGATRGPAFLHDYAALLMGLIELLESRWTPTGYEWCLALADDLLLRFEDRERGGFWFTADDQPTPLMRPKIWEDDASPAANALAARALALLGHLAESDRYLEAAARTVDAGRAHSTSAPGAHLALITSAWILEQPGSLMILRGDPMELPRWQSAIRAQATTGQHLFAVPAEADVPSGLIRRCIPRGPACLYVCTGTQCSEPITSLQALHSGLTGAAGATTGPSAVRDNQLAKWPGGH
jgi:uncharacterized protein YyaL (SSP411 family)